MRQSAQREETFQSPAGGGLPNTVLKGRYRVVSALRETDKAFLFKGVRLENSGEITVKLLKDRIASDSAFIERYSNELEAMQALSGHDGVVKIHEFDYIQGRFCVISDYFHAVSLEDLFARRRTVPVSLILTTMKQLATVIGFAHREGIRHRHLHAGNILISPKDYAVKILRFSFPRTAASSRVPLRSMVFGVGSDLFLLGVFLYRLFCFDYPFQNRKELPELVADRLAERLKTTYKEMSPEEIDTVCKLFIRSTTRDVKRRLSRHEDFLDEIAGLSSRCRPLVARKAEEEARAKRELLETAFDTVAALRGEFRRRSTPTDGLSAEVLRREREHGGLLVWGRERQESFISMESPVVTLALIGAISTLLLGLLYHLFF